MADENTGSANQGDAGNQGTQNNTNAPVSSPMVIPEAFKGEKSLASFKTHEDFVKSHLELSRKLGDAVWLPKEKDDPASQSDKMNRIYKALGRPDTFDGYVADKFAESALDADQINQLRNWAHSNNLSQKQFEAAGDYLQSLYSSSVEAVQKETKAHEDALRKEWGETLFKQRAGLAQAAIKKLGGEELAQVLSERGLGSHPKLVELFAKIGSDMLEGNALDAGEAPGAMSKAEAQAKINEVTSNPNDLYHRKNAGKPGHKERVEEMRRWYQIAYSN